MIDLQKGGLIQQTKRTLFRLYFKAALIVVAKTPDEHQEQVSKTLLGVKDARWLVDEN